MSLNTQPPLRLFQTLCSALLLTGLVLAGVGCGGAGANGEEDSEPDTTPPDPPTNLTADADNDFVSLSWNPVSGDVTYRVYRETASTDSASGSALEADLTQPSFIDETADNGTTYYYRVTAVDTVDNESDGSDEVQSTPFTSPSGLAGSSGDAAITLSWGVAEGAASYNLYRSRTSTSGASGSPLTTGLPQANYTDTTANNGTKYYYRVTAVNPEDEESDASGEVAKTPFSDPARP